MKKIWIGGVIVIVILLAILVVVTKKEKRLDKIAIGAILTLSGEASGYGESAKNAIDMAIDEINASKLLINKEISVIYEDDQLDPKTGVSAFLKLVDINKVPVVIGPLTSSVALAIAPVANERKVVLLSPSASSPNITNAGDYIFRNVASDEYETRVMANYADSEIKIKRVGILYINNDFGNGYKEYFSKFFLEKGGSVPVAETYELGATDFRTQLIKLKKGGIDAIYLVGYKEMGRILRQAKEIGIRSQFLSYSAIEDPDILTQAGDSADGLIYTRQSFDPDDSESVVNKFSASYRLKYKKDPDAYAALSYDSMMILNKAIDDGEFTSIAIKEGLYRIREYPGVTGKTTFDKNGDVTKSVSIKIIRNGTFIYLIKSNFSL